MHDRTGQELKLGDHVIIRGIVTELGATPDFCNLTVVTYYGRLPDGQKETIGAINCAVVDKVTSIEPVAAMSLRPDDANPVSQPITGHADLLAPQTVSKGKEQPNSEGADKTKRHEDAKPGTSRPR